LQNLPEDTVKACLLPKYIKNMSLLDTKQRIRFPRHTT
jgi:hypothetical protein